ncbi:hypothetical protein CVT24_010259 [Panaeolus cyanescens]|uniref:Protein kinase domain-containing protein n=1 Tax=Panaeolus cyanescens TaxID=181874 RepID=A0A409YPZ5_9AGAR|nr:hypothetical protein CVT24_010259 [Panaeolus cyanescens]
MDGSRSFYNTTTTASSGHYQQSTIPVLNSVNRQHEEPQYVVTSENPSLRPNSPEDMMQNTGHLRQEEEEEEGADGDGQPTSPSGRLCSVRGCPTILDEGDMNKMCQHCRGRHRIYASTKRAKRKMEKAALAQVTAAAAATTTMTSPSMLSSPLISGNLSASEAQKSESSGMASVLHGTGVSVPGMGSSTSWGNATALPLPAGSLTTPKVDMEKSSGPWQNVIDPRIFSAEMISRTVNPFQQPTMSTSSTLAHALTPVTRPVKPPVPAPIPHSRAEEEEEEEEENEVLASLHAYHAPAPEVEAPAPTTNEPMPENELAGGEGGTSRVCSVKGCKTIIEASYPYKMCPHCRVRYQKYGTTKRAKWKAEREAFDREMAILRKKEDARRKKEGLPPLSKSPEELRKWELSILDQELPLPDIETLANMTLATASGTIPGTSGADLVAGPSFTSQSPAAPVPTPIALAAISPLVAAGVYQNHLTGRLETNAESATDDNANPASRFVHPLLVGHLAPYIEGIASSASEANKAKRRASSTKVEDSSTLDISTLHDDFTDAPSAGSPQLAYPITPSISQDDGEIAAASPISTSDASQTPELPVLTSFPLSAPGLTPLPARMCTVSHCHRILPGYYRYKRCEQHRLQNRYHSQLKRVREKGGVIGSSASGAGGSASSTLISSAPDGESGGVSAPRGIAQAGPSHEEASLSTSSYASAGSTSYAEQTTVVEAGPSSASSMEAGTQVASQPQEGISTVGPSPYYREHVLDPVDDAKALALVMAEEDIMGVYAFREKMRKRLLERKPRRSGSKTKVEQTEESAPGDSAEMNDTSGEIPRQRKPKISVEKSPMLTTESNNSEMDAEGEFDEDSSDSGPEEEDEKIGGDEPQPAPPPPLPADFSGSAVPQAPVTSVVDATAASDTTRAPDASSTTENPAGQPTFGRFRVQPAHVPDSLSYPTTPYYTLMPPRYNPVPANRSMNPVYIPFLPNPVGNTTRKSSNNGGNNIHTPDLPPANTSNVGSLAEGSTKSGAGLDTEPSSSSSTLPLSGDKPTSAPTSSTETTASTATSSAEATTASLASSIDFSAFPPGSAASVIGRILAMNPGMPIDAFKEVIAAEASKLSTSSGAGAMPRVVGPSQESRPREEVGKTENGKGKQKANDHAPIPGSQVLTFSSTPSPMDGVVPSAPKAPSHWRGEIIFQVKPGEDSSQVQQPKAKGKERYTPPKNVEQKTFESTWKSNAGPVGPTTSVTGVLPRAIEPPNQSQGVFIVERMQVDSSPSAVPTQVAETSKKGSTESATSKATQSKTPKQRSLGVSQKPMASSSNSHDPGSKDSPSVPVPVPPYMPPYGSYPSPYASSQASYQYPYYPYYYPSYSTYGYPPPFSGNISSLPSPPPGPSSSKSSPPEPKTSKKRKTRKGEDPAPKPSPPLEPCCIAANADSNHAAHAYTGYSYPPASYPPPYGYASSSYASPYMHSSYYYPMSAASGYPYTYPLSASTPTTSNTPPLESVDAPNNSSSKGKGKQGPKKAVPDKGPRKRQKFDSNYLESYRAHTQQIQETLQRHAQMGLEASSPNQSINVPLDATSSSPAEPIAPVQPSTSIDSQSAVQAPSPLDDKNNGMEEHQPPSPEPVADSPSATTNTSASRKSPIMSTKPSPSVEDAGSSQVHAAAEYERIKQNFRTTAAAHDAPPPIHDAQLMFQELQRELEEFLTQHMAKVVALRDLLSAHYAQNDSVMGHVHEESGTAGVYSQFIAEELEAHDDFFILLVPTHLARSRTISGQKSDPMSVSGHGHLEMKPDAGLGIPHQMLPSVTQHSSHHGHMPRVPQLEEHIVAMENFLEAHMENVRELQLALKPGASVMPDVRIHPHSAAVTQELHTIPEPKYASYERYNDELTDQFNTVIIISTFSGVLIAVFIAMVQNILLERRKIAFNVGMLFSFFSLAVHLGNIMVAGRGASITSQQFAGHTKAQDLTYFNLIETTVSAKRNPLPLSIFVATDKAFLWSSFFFVSGYSTNLSLAFRPSSLRVLIDKSLKITAPAAVYALIGHAALFYVLSTNWGYIFGSFKDVEAYSRFSGPISYIILLAIFDNAALILRQISFPSWMTPNLSSTLSFVVWFCVLAGYTFVNATFIVPSLALPRFFSLFTYDTPNPSFPLSHIMAYIAGSKFRYLKRSILSTSSQSATGGAISSLLVTFGSLALAQSQWPVLNEVIRIRAYNEHTPVFIDGGFNAHTIFFSLWSAFAFFTVPISLFSLFFHADSTSQSWGTLARKTYIQTYIHMIPILVSVYHMRRVTNLWVKYMVVIVMSISATWIVSLGIYGVFQGLQMFSSWWPIIDAEWESDPEISPSPCLVWENDFLALDVIRKFFDCAAVQRFDEGHWLRLRSSLHRMSGPRFRELCWDVSEEIFRRNNAGRDGVMTLPNHPKLPLGRHKIRQKLSLLASDAFIQVTAQIAFEIGRRDARQWAQSGITEMKHSHPEGYVRVTRGSHASWPEQSDPEYDSILFDLLDNYHRPCAIRRNSEPEMLQDAFPILSRDRFDSTLFTIYRIFKDVMTSDERYSALLSCEGETAQDTLDILQMLMDHSRIPRYMKTRFLSTLFQLSGISGLQPRCFTLKGVKRVGSKFSECYASGGFSEIWKGTLHKQVVCVKILKMYQTSNPRRIMKAVSREAVLWGHLSHVNVLPFYGVYCVQEDSNDRMCLVSPWMDGGTVNEYLERNPDVDRFALVKDVARGLGYLHEHDIIHGDLKGANILVSMQGRACLSDFGLSTIANSHDTNFDPGVLGRDADEPLWGGTPRWQAPELLDPHIEVPCLTRASDVYAFGCVCYEILASLRPFYETPNDLTAVYRVMKGDKPSWPNAPHDFELRKQGLTTDSSSWLLMYIALELDIIRDEDDQEDEGASNRHIGASEFRNAVYRTNYLSASVLESVLSWI